MNAIHKEAYEVENAQNFLEDIGHAYAPIESLSEFAGKDLRSKRPDVVATIDDKLIGIELTAYSYSDSENRWRSFMNKVSERATECAWNFPQLTGISICYYPKLANEPRGRDAALFAKQILGFVKSKLEDSHLAIRERKRFPDHRDPFDQKPFTNWTLLEKHVLWVSFARISNRESYPASVTPGGFTSPMGLCVDLIIKTIEKKAAMLHLKRVVELDEYWLLIHATGSPISSRIIPIEPGSGAEENLRVPTLLTVAQRSGFHRVYIWDGIHHGFAELTEG